jgi:hypothetical protein
MHMYLPRTPLNLETELETSYSDATSLAEYPVAFIAMDECDEIPELGDGWVKTSGVDQVQIGDRTIRIG